MKYADRKGNFWEETTFQDHLMEKLYGSRAGRLAVRLLAFPAVSRICGRFLDSRCSGILVPGYMKRCGIDIHSCEKSSFRSWNDCFTRKLKEGSRKICPDEKVLISPCDGRISVFPVTKEGRFLIKHTSYTTAALLRNPRLAAQFSGGYAWIVRLTVSDYHRYCYVDDAVKTSNFRIRGILHTVNPAANDQEPIYKENTREYTLLRTAHFGTVLMMEVGALLVGKIRNYHGAGSVKKGQEKGRFEFGGSTIVLLTEPGKVIPDPDLLDSTRRGYETVIQMGEPVGKAADR